MAGKGGEGQAANRMKENCRGEKRSIGKKAAHRAEKKKTEEIKREKRRGGAETGSVPTLGQGRSGKSHNERNGGER